MTILITGCRSGFGLLAAITAARAGHTVYAGLRDIDTADELRRRAEGLPVHPVQLDVTSAAQREQVISAIEAEHGAVDGLVNNAGIALAGPLEELDEDELRRVFEINVFAVWALTKRVLPAMRAKGAGRIVNISSMSARMGLPCLGAYAGTKFALTGMSESLRHEVRPFGIQVILIEPGPYRTDIFGRNRNVGRHADTEGGPYQALKATIVRKAEETMASAGDPQEVADRILRALTASAPAPRIPIGPGSVGRRVFKAVVPDRTADWLIQRALSRG